MDGKMFSFTGASHSGKSTLLQYVKENFDIEIKDVSGRRFLDINKGSYDKQMNDEKQIKIIFYYLEETLKNLLECNLEKKNIITTRCIIDCLPYIYSLKVADFLIPQIEENINYIKDKIIILYTACDFPMSAKDDILRGMNEKLRQETDRNFIEILDKLNIPHYKINGSFEERKEKVQNILKYYSIPRINKSLIEL